MGRKAYEKHAERIWRSNQGQEGGQKLTVREAQKMAKDSAQRVDTKDKNQRGGERP